MQYTIEKPYKMITKNAKNKNEWNSFHDREKGSKAHKGYWGPLGVYLGAHKEYLGPYGIFRIIRGYWGPIMDNRAH